MSVDEEQATTRGSAPTSEAGETAPALADLAECVRLARASSADDPASEAARLVDAERQVLTVAADLVAREAELADDRGHPVLAEIGRWRTRLRNLGLADAEKRADALLTEVVGDEALRWEACAEQVAVSGTPDDCYDALTEASVLDREALRRQGDHPEDAPLADRREAVRDAFARLVDESPPDDATRERWATDLLDRADVVLTGIDDLSPSAASAQLEVAAKDIRWHLRHIERRRGPRRRRLKRKLRRLQAEQQERDLQYRLEGIFGARRVGLFERLILWLIFLVLGLLFIESVFDLSPTMKGVFVIVDTLACFVFLWDFFFRLAQVQGKWRWFRRHFLIDLIPSIPVAFLAWRPIRAGRAVRFLRLVRVARYARGLLPLIRMIRAVGFLTRGVDRVVRRYGHLLNRDVVLYPTREEKERSLAAGQGTVVQLRRLHAEVNDLWEDLLLSAYGTEREAVADARLEGLERARADGLTRRPPARGERATATREVTAEVLLRTLESATAEGVEADLGPDFVSRAARAVRLFSRPPLRWIPFLGPFFPRLGPAMGDAEIVAAASHQAARRLRAHYDRWFWFADLYGTVTPAEFVDRVGNTMVKSAFRPAYKLALFGGIVLVVRFLIGLVPWGVLHWLEQRLGPLVTDTVLLLGGICVIILGVGWWLRRVAQRATAFYERIALAQFLPLTESIKGRYLARDAAILSRRVLAPEALLHGEPPEQAEEERQARFVRGVRAWLLEAHAGGDAEGAFDAMERTVLLHRDGLDGGLLHDSDTRTTNQLLGNPALRHLWRTAWCVPPAERKALGDLDLENQRRLVGGPYFWFSLVTRAVAQSVARLIVDYNRYAIPLEELASAGEEERLCREEWLANRDPATVEGAATCHGADESHYVTTAFTALHFLDKDDRRDREVAERFGEAVLRRLRGDRRRLFRRVLGTYPLHTRPHEERVVNLYRIYEAWFAGGKALLLPLRGLWGAVKWIARVLSWVVQAVQQIRRPPSREEYEREAEADFSTAVRKIDRMRGPIVRASLWLRARMDCEYLGVRLPGTRRTGLEGATVARDLDYLDADGDLRRTLEEGHDGAQSDMRRLAGLLDDGLLERVAASLGLAADAADREFLRAAAFAYRADLNGVRSLLSASDILAETAHDAARQPGLPSGICMKPRLWWAFGKWWKANGRGDRARRRAAWRATLRDVNGSQRALWVLSRFEREEAIVEGERRLTILLRHPGRLSGQLVTLRTVQTLALIDHLNYRSHVWLLGDYAADGEDPGRLLQLA